MNGTAAVLAGSWILIAALIIIQPWFTRKNVMFGVVFGSEDVWNNEKAKQMLRRYLWASILGIVLLSILCVLYIILAKPSGGTVMTAYLSGTVALLVFGTIIFIVFHAQARAFKAARKSDADLVTGRISVETSLPDKQTVISAAWLLLFFPVLIAIYCVAVIGYPAMPQLLPIHYSGMVVDGWAPKSWQTVSQPLLNGTVMTLFILICCLFTRRAPASVRGNPEAAPNAFRFRKYMIILMIVLNVLMQTSFLLIEVGFLIPISPLWFYVPSGLGLLLIAVLFYIYFRFVRIKKPRGPILDDDARWVLGMFYYNPSDPSTFIEKRTGIGYTLNFAKPLAWISMVGIIAAIVVCGIVCGH